jgi:HlyD family secretion protein
MASIRLVVSLVSLAALAAGSNLSGQDPVAGAGKAREQEKERQGVEVVNRVSGRARIVLLKPSGSRVKAGEMVCELDASALNDLLTNQRIATKVAEAGYQNAKLTREVAEIAVAEYEEGVFKQDLQTIKGEIALAQKDRQRAEERLEWAKKMKDKGYVSSSGVIAEELGLAKALFDVEQVTTKKAVLERYTKDKTIKQLKSEVEKCRSDELAKKATFELEKAVENRMETQLKNYRIVAPVDGRVVYTRSIEADTVFREGDTLFRIVP